MSELVFCAVCREELDGTTCPAHREHGTVVVAAPIVEALEDTYTEEGVRVWLRGRKQSMDGVSPLDLIQQGRQGAVYALAVSLADGVMW